MQRRLGHTAMRNGSRTAVWASILAVFAAALAAQGALSAGPAITPTSIAGAKLGLGKVAYRKLLGTPVRFQAAGGGAITDPGFQLPQDYTRLVFSNRKMDVYFQGGVDHAIQITTWNKAYRTAEGVGPCSTFARVKAAYGSRLKPDPGNPSGSFIVGRSLIFQLDNGAGSVVSDATRVNAVSLYDGTKPGWNKPGGPLYVASFVGDGPDQVSCR